MNCYEMTDADSELTARINDDSVEVSIALVGGKGRQALLMDRAGARRLALSLLQLAQIIDDA